jgi:hypothetical protein
VLIMAAVGFDPPPAGVVVLPEAPEGAGQLDPNAWVDAVRRPVHRRLRQPVAEHLAQVRDHREA